MLKTILKFLLAGSIITWLVIKGKLDFSLIVKVLDYPLSLVTCYLLLATQMSIATYRWKKLLEVKIKGNTTFFNILKLNWIGLFFNSILPGAVTGDIIKLIYVRDLCKSTSKTFFAITIIMDRIIGLIGLLFLMGLFSIIKYQELTQLSPQITKMIHFNFLIFAGVILFLIYLFLPKKWQVHFLNFANKIPVLGGRIKKTLEQFWIIGDNKKLILLLLVISVFAHTCSIIGFWTISSPFYNKPLSLAHAVTFMPLGFVAMAIPISPAGLGIGHAIFNTLFGFFGISGGASLFNIYWIIFVSNNLLGIIPYTFSGKKHSLKEVDSLKDENALN